MSTEERKEGGAPAATASPAPGAVEAHAPAQDHGHGQGQNQTTEELDHQQVSNILASLNKEQFEKIMAAANESNSSAEHIIKSHQHAPRSIHPSSNGAPHLAGSSEGNGNGSNDPNIDPSLALGYGSSQGHSAVDAATSALAGAAARAMRSGNDAGQAAAAAAAAALVDAANAGGPGASGAPITPAGHGQLGGQGSATSPASVDTPSKAQGGKGKGRGAAASAVAKGTPGADGEKVQVGDVWVTPAERTQLMERAKKDNHKEVERRRRSTINHGIDSLSQIVPGCDAKSTNKGAIISRAVTYIQTLKDNEAANIEKWTLEKLLMDQALADLRKEVDHGRSRETRWAERENLWKVELQRLKTKVEELGGDAGEGNVPRDEDAPLLPPHHDHGRSPDQHGGPSTYSSVHHPPITASSAAVARYLESFVPEAHRTSAPPTSAPLASSAYPPAGTSSSTPGLSELQSAAYAPPYGTAHDPPPFGYPSHTHAHAQHRDRAPSSHERGAAYPATSNAGGGQGQTQGQNGSRGPSPHPHLGGPGFHYGAAGGSSASPAPTGPVEGTGAPLPTTDGSTSASRTRRRTDDDDPEAEGVAGAWSSVGAVGEDNKQSVGSGSPGRETRSKRAKFT